MRTFWPFSLAVVATGCAVAGGPLGQTFDPTLIAAVPLEKKQSVVEAQQRFEFAQLQSKGTHEEFETSEVEQDLADYQSERAIVLSQVVAARGSDAKPAPNLQTDTLLRKTAGAKLAFSTARREWLSQLDELAMYIVYSTQAQLELERARVASANQVMPAGTTVVPYQQQADVRYASAQAAVAVASHARTDAEARWREWSELETQLLQASTLKGPLESAHFVGKWRNVELPSPLAAAPPPAPAQEPAKPQPDPAPAAPPGS
jgi:hypothetical protein